ncbi:MAG: protein-L-isoaspartate(D-aspartate) O-methyltransferase [Deltaproteobacteria bacterium]|nr:protein-L-isoaspartate(D-aspartate) O-methyltransferase [Deltaproteobacteria bacterium]
MKTHPAQRMLEAIRLSYRYSFEGGFRQQPPEAVLEAMARVPREEFVPPDMRSFAYDNQALPIRYQQTISQPFIVALMTDLLDPEPEDIVLEVGSGSGYQAAILSLLVKKVYSLEIIQAMAEEARKRLSRLGFNNIEIFEKDGYMGLPEHAPYDGIIVTAATPTVPPPLIHQLKPGGRLIIPIGEPPYYQELTLIHKNEEGEVSQYNVLGVAFVPLRRRCDL